MPLAVGQLAKKTHQRRRMTAVDLRHSLPASRIVGRLRRTKRFLGYHGRTSQVTEERSRHPRPYAPAGGFLLSKDPARIDYRMRPRRNLTYRREDCDAREPNLPLIRFPNEYKRVGAIDSDLRFQILGKVRVRRGERDLTPTGMQQKTILALLLANAGQVVSPYALVEILWPDEPPARAMNILHRHIVALRRHWQPDLPNRSAGRWLLRQAGGYRLAVAEDSLDLLHFRRLMTEAGADDTGSGLRTYAEAINLWQAPAAADLDPRVRAHPDIVEVRYEFGAASRDFARAAVRLGEAAYALPVLLRAIECQPFDETLQARLIRLQAAAGHRADALDRYEWLRERLADEFGVDPAPELREAYESVFCNRANDPMETGTDARAGSCPPPE
ncbi:AfsR/SARP family transcriptional regulator [Actinoplanes sp. TBRC 11911]|uniref:AfsR/SARP family transcriptional regulator n=1 Tax=Actinoplanes sp. TBRC 11911 TaxID=2729386 RepID=UPI00145D85D4|nr:AfsR/SARP family transcriptional regulator [Actinoplanes sp. TBRC 11911]NMO55708.1 AfsR/SARP family transcriptional regulator [Actinoplanes sp. TBRC 11911]